MQIITIKSYKNIFGKDDFVFEEFLISVPKNIAIKICCHMSSIIYTRQSNIDFQIEILKFLLRRQDTSLQKSIFKSVFDIKKKEINIFKQVYINEFLLYCLNNCNDFEYDDGKTENDLLFFKAYIKVSEIFNNQHGINEGVSKEEYFQVNIWPLMISQIKENNEIYPFTPYLKSILFFHYIVCETNVKDSLIDYFKTLKQEPINFLHYLMGIISEAIKGERSLVLKVDEVGATFFEKFVFKDDEYQKTEDKPSYLMINPLFKIGNGEYLIFNYNFLCNKIFTGFLYDFFKTSLRGKVKRINRFPIKNFNDYKSFIGEMFTEKYLFRILIKTIFKNKYFKILFNDQNIDSFPDALIIYKNEIIIFEIKDATVPAYVFQSRSYEDIKKMLENKYGAHNKGTGQIVKFLRKLSNDKYFDFLISQDVNININKAKVYPVIIYTESTFDCPGFMNFLNNNFIDQVNLEFKKNPFKHISRLNFINLDFMIDKIDVLSKRNTSLLKAIKEISIESKRREKKLNRNFVDGDLESFNANFESYFMDIFKSDDKNGYINFLNKEFGLVEIFKEISKYHYRS